MNDSDYNCDECNIENQHPNDDSDDNFLYIPISKSNKKKRRHQQQYYWNLEPYVSLDQAPPPPCWYTGSDWIGDIIYVGFVLRIQQGNVKNLSNQALLAHRLLHTETNNDDYKK